MNKPFPNILIKKTGIIACLFFSFCCEAQSWKFSTSQLAAYDNILRLEVNQGQPILRDEQSAEAFYIQSFGETLELLLSESTEDLDLYEQRLEKRLETLSEKKTPGNLFVRAELNLQWSFVALKTGHEFDAAWRLRSAYNLAEECRRRFPKFVPIRKTTGLLEVMIGSIPEKYNWVLGLLGLEGTIENGLADLESAAGDPHFSLESRLLRAMVDAFVLQQTESAANEMQALVSTHRSHPLVLFLAASIAIKNAQSEQALVYLTQLDSIRTGLPLYYKDYLFAEVLLHKGEYPGSIASYQEFLKHYPGKNYVKDAHFKIALNHHLLRNEREAQRWFDKAKVSGIENSEADKSAARTMNMPMPDIQLIRVRYFTDGGYYARATEVFDSIGDLKYDNVKDQVEFCYRKGRLFHKAATGDPKPWYLKTIELAGESPWYFAPNAALQLGYLYLAEGESQRAREYFEKAMSYKKHEYKNSIDAKARSAISQIRRK